MFSIWVLVVKVCGGLVFVLVVVLLVVYVIYEGCGFVFFCCGVFVGFGGFGLMYGGDGDYYFGEYCGEVDDIDDDVLYVIEDDFCYEVVDVGE